MRGEDPKWSLEVRGVTGSPPHARGRHHFGENDDGFLRITPACAGKTSNSLGRYLAYPDHPRMRGEDIRMSARSAGVHSGSPPHARGRQKS